MNRAEEGGADARLFLCALPFVPGQAAAYIMGVRKGRGAYVSERRRMLDTGRLCGGAGGRDPDCGDLSGRGADVFGGGPADCVRLRLLQALERSKYHANCSVEVPQSPQRHSAEAVQDFGISSPGRAYSVSRARLRGQHGGAQGRESGRWRPLPPRTVFQAAGNGCAVHRRTNGRKGRANHGTGIEKGLLRRL